MAGPIVLGIGSIDGGHKKGGDMGVAVKEEVKNSPKREFITA